MNDKMIVQFTGTYDDLKKRVLSYYQHCSPREQKLLVFTSVVLPLMIVMFGLVLPIYDRTTELEYEVVAAQQQFSEAEIIASKLLGNSGKVNPRGDILVIVERSLRELKVRQFITRMKPMASLSGKKSLLVQMKGLPYSGVIRLLDRMSSAGISLNHLKLRSIDKSGFVDVEMKLQ